MIGDTPNELKANWELFASGGLVNGLKGTTSVFIYPRWQNKKIKLSPDLYLQSAGAE
jgi:hypothetical protein